MQTKRQDRPRQPASCLIVWCLLIFMLAGASSSLGQGITILDSFNGANGAMPTGLIQGQDGNFYGTTSTGGSEGGGCVYQVTPTGVITILHTFGGKAADGDGGLPTAGLIQASDKNFYGTTSRGGTAGEGTVFSITSTGTITILHSFGDSSVLGDGLTPHGSLVQGADGLLYGTTSQGGSAGQGAIFSMTLQGHVTILYSFGTNAGDGLSPEVGLTSDGQGNFYGTTIAGGVGQGGTVFALNAQKQVSIIYSFTRPAAYTFTSGSSAVIVGGPGGSSPDSRLTLGQDGNLYGTAAASGYGYGVLYKLTPQGQETVLHRFGDGAVPLDGRAILPVVEAAENVLTQDAAGNFYGTTVSGGADGLGTLYELSSTGQFTILHSFGSNIGDGDLPISGVILSSDGTIYGTTSAGGVVGVDLPPLAPIFGGSGTIAQSGSSVSLATIFAPSSTNPITEAFLAGGNPGTINFDSISGIITITSSGSGAVVPHLGTIFKVVPGLPAITSPLHIFGAVGTALSYQTVATQSPTSYAATGLPANLSIDPTSGLISGTPMSAGTTSVTLTVTNGSGSTTATLVITILSPPVVTSVLTEFATTGATFGYQIAATGSPYLYAATGLPAGLMLDPSAGVIFGTPTVTGTFPVTISATNAIGTDTETLSLVISATAPTLAQEYLLIHSFDDGSVSGEGDFPGALLPGPNSSFFGVTTQGGTNGVGTVFHLSSRGLGRVLSPLGSVNGSAPQGLVLGPDGNYYGTTQNGGSANQGTIFMITPTGTVTLLHTFGDLSVPNDGANPQAGLIYGPDGYFYGTTQYGGASHLGTLFKMTLLGKVTILHSFGSGTDGAQPVAAVVQTPNGIFGTTLAGGTAGDGTVFDYAPNGTFSIVHNFGDTSVTNDGQLPHAALVADPVTANLLYGTTVDGGTLGRGTIFSISTTTNAVTILHNFGDGTVPSDGTYPVAPLLLYDNPQTGLTLFGTTPTGGTAGDGTIFAMDASNHVTILHHFGDGTVANDGQTPMAGLCLDASGNLYGTTMGGGSGSGTMFAVVANFNPPTSTYPLGLWTCSGNLPLGLTFDSTTGTIMGTPLSGDRVGNYTFTITSPTMASTTQMLTLNQTFAQWAAAMGNPNQSTSATSVDGVASALKYVFDLKPNGPITAGDHAAMPAVGYDTASVAGKAFVTLTYRQNAALTGMGVTLETSDDMVNWSPVSSTQMLSKQIGTDATTASGDPIMEVGAPVDGSPKQFVRLKVVPQ